MSESCETKTVLRNGNEAIINVEDFNPETDEDFTPPAPKPNTKDEIMAALSAAGIEFSADMKKAELQALLDES